jgi:XTP/dITP diphosphohydrolase
MARQFHSPQLLIASSNKGKLRELQNLLANTSVTLISAADYTLTPPEETGLTFAENARLKAQYYSEATGLPALADDSGLCVEELNGLPGIYSARWAVDGYGKAMERIRQELGAASPLAYFACALCLWWPDGHSEQVEGRIAGTLSFTPRGTQGFGYDPFFIPHGYDVSFAEMEPKQKNAISHRAEAFRQLIGLCFS